MSHDASEIKEQLTQIKHANDTIIPEMDKALREVKEKFVNMFPVDMSSVIEETINENRLRPHQYADLGAIHEVDHEIMHSEVNLGQLERAVHRTVIDEEQTDSEWSRKFHL